MPLRYVLDEHLRGPLFHAIQSHSQLGAYPLDVTRVGDPADLPLGTLDSALLEWAEREGRILVTVDRNTMAGHLTAHLTASSRSPGGVHYPAALNYRGNHDVPLRCGIRQRTVRLGKCDLVHSVIPAATSVILPPF